MKDIESIRKMRGLAPDARTGFGTGFSAATVLDLDDLADNRKSLTKTLAAGFPRINADQRCQLRRHEGVEKTSTFLCLSASTVGSHSTNMQSPYE